MSESLFLYRSKSRQQLKFLCVTSSVIAMHFGLLLLGRQWQPVLVKPMERTKVLVQTIQLAPPQPIPAQNALPSVSKQPEQVASPQNLPVIAEPIQKNPVQEKPVIKEKPAVTPAPIKKEIKPQAIKPIAVEKKPVPKKTAPVKKAIETAKKAPPKKDPALENEKKKQQEKIEAEKKLQKAEEERKKQQLQKEIDAAEKVTLEKEKSLQAKFAKLRETSSSQRSTSLAIGTLPKEIGSLQIDSLQIEIGETAGWGKQENSYKSELASRLKKSLRLPDYGTVKLNLTLDPSGKVLKVEILSSESSKNRAYVESHLPTLQLTPFGTRFQDKLQMTLPLTLQND